MQLKKLHILGSIITYKASAGSGKTFTLVYDYIKYLFLAQKSFVDLLNQCKSGRDLDNIKPNKSIWQRNVHRRTLAVTFTNKSTAEMKERIIVSLSLLADNHSNSPYLSKLRDELLGGELKINSSFSEKIIQIVSSLLLSDILQDFSGFRVQTIDGFFQQVVRSFASELDINNKYQVELDTQQIFDMAVDNMLASLDSLDKKNLLNWLTEYAKDKVDDSKSWNPRGDIQKLATLLLSENYVSKAEEFSNVDNKALNDYRTSLRDVVKNFETDLQRLCNVALCRCVEIGANNLNSKAISSSTFDAKTIIKKKFKFSKTFIDAAGDSDKWCKKDKLGDCTYGDLEALSKTAKAILDLCADGNKEFIEYNTAKIILSNLYIVGILGELSQQVNEICLSNDLMIIASTTEFLQKIINNSDTPFIYEKIGVKTDHYMIDEFQDTSNMQWKNFIPLLKESVSSGNESMLVGDVKQSIYRWRNGDWKILHSGVKEEFENEVTTETLDTNYRSCTEVVNFANSLFGFLPTKIDENIPKPNDKHIPESKIIKFSDVYSDSRQELPSSAKDKNKYQGYVKCTCFKKEKGAEADALSRRSLDSICKDIANLKDKKIPLNDMAVLVRTNKEARNVADRLREEGIPFCSADALLMGDNGAVKFLIATI
ncbi:MAG: UvrD-helicase domain-containing protein, partial [bacterium]